MNKYLTPYKYGAPVLTGSGVPGAFDENCVDCPYLFYHQGKFFLMYVGFDSKGYQTALATSDDLIHWEKKGLILERDNLGRWDSVGAAGTSILRDTNDFNELPTLKKVNGKYWMAYHSYPSYGYETGPAEIGLAWCDDEDLMDWHRLEQPVFSWRDGQDWDKGGLYKAWLMEHEGTFHIFYNAKNKDTAGWVEQTGMATSQDMIHWERCGENPVLPVSEGKWDSKFTSDPMVLRDGDHWVMFYFGYDYHHAQEGIAFSKDLVHWEKHPEPILRVGTGDELDTIHAHKPSVVLFNNVFYHMYCACRPWRPGDVTKNFGSEFRCLTIATSEPMK
jgi:predicted GH43/DUF377 family glycosyl hydrolase